MYDTGAESEPRSALCDNSVTFLLVNRLHAGLISHRSTAAESQTKQANRWRARGWNLIDPHITHSSISPPRLHIENITLYFTRGLKRTEHLLSYKEQRIQAKYVQQTWSHRAKVLWTYRTNEWAARNRTLWRGRPGKKSNVRLIQLLASEVHDLPQFGELETWVCLHLKAKYF